MTQNLFLKSFVNGYNIQRTNTINHQECNNMCMILSFLKGRIIHIIIRIFINIAKSIRYLYSMMECHRLMKNCILKSFRLLYIARPITAVQSTMFSSILLFVFSMAVMNDL